MLACVEQVTRNVPASDAVPATHVTCELHEAPEAGASTAGERDPGWLRWAWKLDEAQISTRNARAQLWRRESGYSVQAWLRPESHATRTLVGAISSAILHDLGGLVLHSGSVLSAGGVVAFIGPSGAGKSTACRHMLGDPIFSLDRLAVLPCSPEQSPEPTRAGVQPAWFAYPWPGGTAIDPDKPHAVPRWSRLRGILRVRQSMGAAQVEACSPAAAVALLRESTYHGCPDARVEGEILHRLERLAGAVPVGRVYFALGPSLTPPVSRWLCS